MKLVTKVRGKSLSDFILKLRQHLYQQKIKMLYLIKKSNYFHDYADNFILSGRELPFGKNSLLFSNQVKNIDFDLIDPALKRSLNYTSAQILEHELNILGSGKSNINTKKIKAQDKRKTLDKIYMEVDWHMDFKSNFRWPKNLFYTHCRKVSSKVSGVDIKVPWELSRCQHFGTLAATYLLMKDDAYVLEIKNQMIDWIINNPYCKGPNWVCAMEVSIRAVNWCVALDLISHHYLIANDDEFLALICKAMWLHQEFILNNLEWTSKLTSNHYLSNIVGLFFISIYFPIFINSDRVLNFCLFELEKEIIAQTYPDGMNIEGSTCYHRLVLEMFSYATILAKNVGVQFSAIFMQRLEKMFLVSESLMNEITGKMIQIGDNDSGVLLSFQPRERLKIDYLAILRTALYGGTIDASLKRLNIEGFLFNVKHQNTSSSLKQNAPYSSNVFRDAGLYIYKNGQLFLTIYNGKNGQNGNGGHAHNDKLSFTLNWGGTIYLLILALGATHPILKLETPFVQRVFITH